MADTPFDRLRAIFPRYIAKIEALGDLYGRLPPEDIAEACVLVVESMEALADEMQAILCAKCQAALEERLKEKSS